MMNALTAGKEVVNFLSKHGFDPEMVAANQMGVAIMAAWVNGELDHRQTLRSLENLEIISGKPLRLKNANT